jgi:hypothetical protein
MRPRTTDSLEVVLHLAQLGHDGDGVGLAGGLLDLGVLSLALVGWKNHGIWVPT